MMTAIGQSIRVGVVFGEDRQITPKWFFWNGKKHDILKVTFSWKIREGHNILHHFAVTDADHLYELCYDTGAGSWRLEALSPLD